MGKQAADWLAPGTRNRARAWQVRVSSVSRWPAGAATGPAKSRSASTEGPKAERWLFGPRPAPSRPPGFLPGPPGSRLLRPQRGAAPEPPVVVPSLAVKMADRAVASANGSSSLRGTQERMGKWACGSRGDLGLRGRRGSHCPRASWSSMAGVRKLFSGVALVLPHPAGLSWDGTVGRLGGGGRGNGRPALPTAKPPMPVAKLSVPTAKLPMPTGEPPRAGLELGAPRVAPSHASC
jgi:hypothetical protein|uniref:Uncharacterized protein LOC109675933 isoform X1 n=1 Tax=Castor canadensis TaxID=51338 RepID=A0A8B7TKM7_CASCN|nr:uncharacterized protein LOC109675933 isoform X1 [Castor canadensis]XP_020008099.1 uncharacterized protein LOC109675933 isoform X2 [Castor canadensis]